MRVSPAHASAILICVSLVLAPRQINFVKQQGFEDASVRTCDLQYPALMFQPRVAQTMAATFMLVIGVCLLAGWVTLAWIFEALLIVALGALIFGAFCSGSFLFHLLTGNGAFARRILPWGQGS